MISLTIFFDVPEFIAMVILISTEVVLFLTLKLSQWYFIYLLCISYSGIGHLAKRYYGNSNIRLETTICPLEAFIHNELIIILKSKTKPRVEIFFKEKILYEFISRLVIWGLYLTSTILAPVLSFKSKTLKESHSLS